MSDLNTAQDDVDDLETHGANNVSHQIHSQKKTINGPWGINTVNVRRKIFFSRGKHFLKVINSIEP